MKALMSLCCVFADFTLGGPASASLRNVTFTGTYELQEPYGQVLTQTLGSSGNWKATATYDTATNSFENDGVFSFGDKSFTLASAPTSQDYDDGTSSVKFDFPPVDFSKELQAKCDAIGGCDYKNESNYLNGELGVDFDRQSPLETSSGFKNLSEAGGASGFDETTGNIIFSTHQAGSEDDINHYESDLQFESTNLSYNAAPVSAAPEPATWAMMILGFGVVGFLLLYKRERQPHLGSALAA